MKNNDRTIFFMDVDVNITLEELKQKISNIINGKQYLGSLERWYVLNKNKISAKQFIE